MHEWKIRAESTGRYGWFHGDGSQQVVVVRFASCGMRNASVFDTDQERVEVVGFDEDERTGTPRSGGVRVFDGELERSVDGLR